jgi:tRNA-2-methylthio-N6-dimethylallyladenosine synthase
MTKKLFIKTYGCQMNEYDSARIYDLLAVKLNISKTESPNNADIILLNTCSVRAKAQEKVFSDLGRYYLLKKNKPDLIIGVGGCVASQEGKKILQRAPYVNLVFGPQTLHRLPQMLTAVQIKHEHPIDVSFPKIEKFTQLPKPKPKTASAFVTIMEGCNNFCSYCIVPYTRGREISRSANDILNEIHALSQQNVTEIVLLGQNVNNYCGENKNANTNSTKINLAQLIHEVAAIETIKRIRFTTSNPKSFTDELIATFATTPKLANHLHLPVQSGSNNILKAMHRGYTTEEYLEKIHRLRSIRPNISISTDFIVGFPNETEQDFNDTIQLAKQISFDNSFSFMYSPRKGTQAAQLTDNIFLATKKKRLALLQNLLKESAVKISMQMVNSTQTVLVTGNAKKNSLDLTGRTSNNRIVNFSGNKNLIGKFVDVKITTPLVNSLRGKLIGEHQ